MKRLNLICLFKNKTESITKKYWPLFKSVDFNLHFIENKGYYYLLSYI